MEYICTLLSVTDLARARSFYCDVLGMTVTADFGANITLDGRIALQTMDTWKSFLRTDAVTLGHNASELYFETDDLDALSERLSAPPADFSVTTPDQRTPALIDALTAVWRASVTGTHTFLTAREIDQIAQYVPDALRNVPVLIAAQGTDGQPIGFAGVNGDKLEMLFLHPDHLGQRLGTRLLNFVCEVYGVREVCVNEQNPKARAFYTHAGFAVYRRSPLDEMGQPFPLLYLKKDTK